MDTATRGKLGAGATSLRWLFEPASEVSDAGRSFLLGQLLSAPAAAIMGSLCAIVIVTVALLRSGHPVYAILLGLECTLIVWRFAD